MSGRKIKENMSERIIIGITGASGVIYGIRMLEHLKKVRIETHLVISEAGRTNIEIETGYNIKDVEILADRVYDNRDMAAAVASGSFLARAMIILPCTIKTLSAVANSYTSDLMARAADVTLKEKRKLVLAIRETPLHKGHLKLMLNAADLGALILPPVPSFYHNPETINDLIDQTIGKMFDYVGIEHNLFNRWDGVDADKKNKIVHDCNYT